MKKLISVCKQALRDYWRNYAAFRLAYALPRQVVTWAAIRVACHNCPGHPGERTMIEALDAWEKTA